MNIGKWIQIYFLCLFQNDIHSAASNPVRGSSWGNQSSNGRPPPLFGHAMETVPGGFVIFGGMSPSGLSDKLWFFDLTTFSFELKATDSDWKPPALSEHTLTSAKGFLYVFGGSSLHGKFSRQMFRISETGLSEWEPVETRGTKETDLRVTGHTMVYSDQCRSVAVFNFSIIKFFSRFYLLEFQFQKTPAV